MTGRACGRPSHYRACPARTRQKLTSAGTNPYAIAGGASAPPAPGATRPSRIAITMLARAVTLASWVAQTMQVPCSARAASSSATRIALASSRLAVGSSATIRAASAARARASATRWRSPPDRPPAGRRASSCRPTSSSAASARCLAGPGFAAAGAQAERDVVERRQPGDQRRDLRDDGDGPGPQCRELVRATASTGRRPRASPCRGRRGPGPRSGAAATSCRSPTGRPARGTHPPSGSSSRPRPRRPPRPACGTAAARARASRPPRRCRRGRAAARTTRSCGAPVPLSTTAPGPIATSAAPAIPAVRRSSGSSRISPPSSTNTHRRPLPPWSSPVTRPSRIVTVRVAASAARGSCVASRIVAPSSRASSASSSRIAAPGRRVELAGDLVDQQQPRPHRDRHTQRRPLLLAAGELAAARLLAPFEADPFEQLARARPRAAGGPSRRAAPAARSAHPRSGRHPAPGLHPARRSPPSAHGARPAAAAWPHPTAARTRAAHPPSPAAAPPGTTAASTSPTRSAPSPPRAHRASTCSDAPCSDTTFPVAP